MKSFVQFSVLFMICLAAAPAYAAVETSTTTTTMTTTVERTYGEKTLADFTAELHGTKPVAAMRRLQDYRYNDGDLYDYQYGQVHESEIIETRSIEDVAPVQQGVVYADENQDVTGTKDFVEVARSEAREEAGHEIDRTGRVTRVVEREIIVDKDNADETTIEVEKF